MTAPTKGSQKNANGQFSAQGAVTVTEHDDTVYDPPLIGFMIETQGDVSVRFADGSSAILPGLVAGVVHPFAVDKILDTDTDDVGAIIGFY